MRTQDISTFDRAAECETRITHLWEKNLGVPAGRKDDYFQSGGDSLRGAQLLSWIQEGFGIEFSLLDLFESRTIADQTRLVLTRLDAANAATPRGATDYLYFGPAQAPLFGALHRPGFKGLSGVVLCYPMGQEYMRIHRTYVELSRRLAAAGHYVLRFDYFGCGDSGGDSLSGSLDRWTVDIFEAVRKLRCIAGVRDVYLVGSRIGANLALTVGTASFDVAGLVLWEPIVNGRDYFASLLRAHRDLLAHNARLDGYEQHARPKGFAEAVGFPITRKLYDELVAIDLLATPASETMPDALVLANSRKPALDQYVNTRRSGHNKLDYVTVDESDGIWLKEDRQNKGLIPVRAIQTVASWITTRAV